MEDVELMIINAGIGSGGRIDWERENQIIQTNAAGFAALASAAMEYFTERGSGHIVGISSIAAIKGLGRYTAYSASKAFISTYMQGLRQRSRRRKLHITVTDVKPGFVNTPMTEGNKGMFWVVPLEKAARQIYSAIQKRKNHAYISKRWRLASWFLKLLPDWIYIRMPG
jgi:short-subunit dehydrogenase